MCLCSMFPDMIWKIPLVNDGTLRCESFLSVVRKALEATVDFVAARTRRTIRSIWRFYMMELEAPSLQRLSSDAIHLQKNGLPALEEIWLEHNFFMDKVPSMQVDLMSK